MQVKLISVTDFTGVRDDDGRKLTPEQGIVYIARVSNPSNQLNTATADRLIAYLIKKKHWSPFDMVNLCVSVTTSRAIAHQILRHWSIKPQEFSQRYAEATDYEDIELRLKADTNRQSSTEIVAAISFYRDEKAEANKMLFTNVSDSTEEYRVLALRFAKHVQDADELYRKAIKMGIASECARFILPLCTQTTLYLNGSVRSWIHYLEQRTSDHAQKEHRLVAEQVRELFSVEFPNIMKAIDQVALEAAK